MCLICVTTVEESERRVTVQIASALESSHVFDLCYNCGGEREESDSTNSISSREQSCVKRLADKK